MLGQSPGQQVSPAGQSFLQTAVSQVLPPAASTNSMVAPSTGIHPQQSMISMLTPGIVALNTTGSVQQVSTPSTPQAPVLQPVHTQFHPPHVLVPANPYLHEGMFSGCVIEVQLSIYHFFVFSACLIRSPNFKVCFFLLIF